VALELMAQLKERGHPKTPPALATDGKGSYREAMLQTWGYIPEYGGEADLLRRNNLVQTGAICKSSKSAVAVGSSLCRGRWSMGTRER
jgi:hypothetical protein